MAKDKRAREMGQVTAMAIANLIAAMADTMRAADVPQDIVHDFLERLERINDTTLWGYPAEFLSDVVYVIRRAVPCND